MSRSSSCKERTTCTGQRRFPPAPDFSSTVDVAYITGLGAVDARMLILVDIEKLLSGIDMALVDTAH